MTFDPLNSPSEPTRPAGAAGHRLTVLLGDEDDAAEAWHANARGLLGAQGIETIVARTGRQALELMEDSVLGSGVRIHVAVLDQRMSGMGGLQVLRRLQTRLEEARPSPQPRLRSEVTPHGSAAPTLPPAILLAEAQAASLSSALMHDALTMRVFSVLPRPVELNLLLDTLARALKRHYHNRWPTPPRPER